MTIVKQFEHGIIEETNEKTYKYRLTLDHEISKKRRLMNAYGNNWLYKELEDAIEGYNHEIKLVSQIK